MLPPRPASLKVSFQIPKFAPSILTSDSMTFERHSSDHCLLELSDILDAVDFGGLVRRHRHICFTDLNTVYCNVQEMPPKPV